MRVHDISVEVHPASAVLPPEMKSWRVLVDGVQHSVHDTPEEAEEAAEEARNATATGWTPPVVATSPPPPVPAKGDWKR